MLLEGDVWQHSFGARLNGLNEDIIWFYVCCVALKSFLYILMENVLFDTALAFFGWGSV